MKKTIGILIGVAALVAVVYYTDRKLAPVQISAASPAKPSDVPPSVMFKDLSGKDVSISEMRGKVVLVDFWATWCEPCQIEIPWLIELQQKYGTKGFTIIGVAMDESGQKAVDPYLAKTRFDVNGQKLPINYPVLIGNDRSAETLAPEMVGYPTSVLISRDGKIIKTTIGLVSFDEIEKDIKTQLGI